MADPQTIISARIQNRRGLRQDLPQPLLPGELGLATDTGQLFIGADPLDPASITAPIIEIYSDYVTDTTSDELISNSYVIVANRMLGTVPEVAATASVVRPVSIYRTNIYSMYSFTDNTTLQYNDGTAISFVEVIEPGFLEASLTVADTAGAVTGISIDTAGTGYAVGNTVTVEHPYGTGAVATVSSITEAGGITGIDIATPGSNYQPEKYGYVVRVKTQEYTYIDTEGATQTAIAVPDISTSTTPAAAIDNVMFVPDYARLNSNYTGHSWMYIAYKLPIGKTLPTINFTYTDNGTEVTESFTDVRTIPYPALTTPFDNEPTYSFVGKPLNLSIQSAADAESYNAADSAALAQAINWSFDNGISGFDGINTNLGIVGATGRGTGLVTVAQNIEIHTERGSRHNTELATLVKSLRSTTPIANDDAFNTGLVSRHPTPLLVVQDGVITSAEFTLVNQIGLGYTSNPDVTVFSSGGTGALLSATVNNNSIDSVEVINGGEGYAEDATLVFSAPAGLRSTGIWYDLDGADSFSIKYSVKNSTDARKGELSVMTLGQDFIIEDTHLHLTTGTEPPLSLAFVPDVDALNNIMEIKYSAASLPNEDINPTSLSTTTLRWKNF
jgi:hypothetical protein